MMELRLQDRLDLHTLDGPLRLKKGSMQLFFIENLSGNYEGHKVFVADVKPGNLIFPMPDEERFHLIGFPESPCNLERAERLEVSEVDNWLYKLSTFFDLDIQRREDEIVEPGESYSFEENFLISGDKHLPLLWVDILEGECQLGPIEHPHIKGLFPLKSRVWLKGVSSGILKGVTSQEVLSQERLSEGLEQFHRLVFASFQAVQQAEQSEDRDMLKQKELNEKELLQDTLHELTSILGEKDAVRYQQGDALFNACQLIGRNLKTPFNKPLELPENASHIEELEAICVESGLRKRRLLLSGEWWNAEAGPILGFLGPDHKPVALLKQRGKYRCFDPDGKNSKPLTSEVISQLSKEAYTFYLPFPDTLEGGKGVLKFFFKHTQRSFYSLFFFGVLAALIALFPPIATQVIFKNVIPKMDMPLFWEIALGLFVAAISMSLFTYFRTLAMVQFEGIGENLVQSALWDRIFKLRMTFFRRFTIGNLIRRTLSLAIMRTILTYNLSNTLINGFFSLFYLFIMFIYSARLALISTLALLVGTAITLICTHYKVKVQNRLFEKRDEMMGFNFQIISGINKLRVAGAEKRAFSFWSSIFSKYTIEELKTDKIQAVATVTNAVLPLFAYGWIFYTIFHQLSKGAALSLPDFLAFNVAFLVFSAAVVQFNNTIISVSTLGPQWKRSKVILEEPPEFTLKKKKPGPLRGEIHIDDVSFRYDKDGPLILNNVSIHISPGESIAIIGSSGSGKSTLVNLLLGFETPEQGNIYYDGNALSNLNVKAVRQQMGTVLQQSEVFAGSILENITCGAQVTQEDLERALTFSAFDQDLADLPMGLHTYVSMGGENFSGGQKQRLAIARALITNPRILIMDEATSALDNITQERVVHNLEEYNITRIIIAHRLSTIKDVDRVFLMERGKVVDSGTFEELSTRSELFNTILERQSL